ncbi:NB-ARC domain-containing protein [Merismopedia glauca]|uniref:Uncharacterized protein n=1 Tax=Merismopedia glauca CCAP 1448/3 TaxID=1296344 RepID=A0A2T1BZ58_9CYAN|nr:NB-ARC domain-containing protein [Merismopedia glauca]PSB01197.1 hypothetical protein C7B64_19600 [Merismopedia glauca CCAP 1448/3]
MNLEQTFKIADAIVFSQKKRHLKDIEVAILKGALRGETYGDIAANYGCTAEYIKHDIGPKFWKLLSELLAEKVSKKNFRSALERKYDRWQLHLESDLNLLSLSANPLPTRGFKSGEIVKYPDFIGRNLELAQLKFNLLERNQRLVVISGVAGIGKTVLATHLLEAIAENYESCFWTSLLNYSSFSDWLTELNILINGAEISELNSDNFIHKFSQSKSLLVIDNLEAAKNLEIYLLFIKKILINSHNTRIVIISRNPINEICTWQNGELAIQKIELTGLSNNEAHLLFKNRGFAVSAAESSFFSHHYQGNPLALKLLATTIKTSCQNQDNSAQIRSRFPAIFGKIEEILEHHFECLSSLEKQIMYCLVTAKKSLGYREILEQIITPISEAKLGEILNLLVERSLIEKAIFLTTDQSSVRYTLQPLIKEYMSQRFEFAIPQTAKNL